MALVAPAGPLDSERIERSAERCRGLGLEPVVFPHATGRRRYLAGSDEERAADLQSAVDDPDIGAIWALRGGYGTLRILDRVDLRRQRVDPIPYIGFSDNTTFLVRHALLGVVSFHGPHPGADFPPETESFFRKVLFSSEPAGPLPFRAGDPPPAALVGGRVEAPLFGGNLAMLASMLGSGPAFGARGRILFLEEIAEPAYRVDRTLVQLERAGVLAGVAGLAFGRFTQPTDDEHSVREVVRELALRLDVPAVVDLPFGHVEHNCTLPLGVGALLDADTGTLSLVQGAVRR